MSATTEPGVAGDPPDYPQAWEADVVASDGATVHVRPIVPADADGLVALHARSSQRTLYLRFFGPYPRIPERDLHRFTNVDYRDRVALVVELGDELIAVGRYERLDDRDEAEVAFLVEDAHQGRGLGSVLLEHLAAAGQEMGVVRFVAEVLADNHKMVQVFRHAGYDTRRSFDDGVVHLSFDIAPTDALRAVRYEREQRSESRSIERLLTPRTVAVIGASTDPNKLGYAILANLLVAGFTGGIYPVNPQAETVHGLTAYPTVLEVPDEVDLAVLAVPADEVPKVVVHCRARGVRGIVVVSGGFAERGEQGRAAQLELVATARASGMRIVGPNCFGIINTDPDFRLDASLATGLPDRGRIGMFSQSGALGAQLLERAGALGIGLSTFVSAGNRADVSGNDLLQYWATDPATEVIALHLESFGNPRKFARLARRVARHKPIVMVKSGRHTGASPGLTQTSQSITESSVDALFASTGLIRVDTVAELFDTVSVLAHQPLPRGRRVAVVGNSTAVGLLALDALLGNGLVPAGSGPTDIGSEGSPEDFAAAVGAALADPEVDAVLPVFVPPVAIPEIGYARALLDLAENADKPIIATFLGRDGVRAPLARPGEHGGATRGSVPSLPVDRAAGALARVVRYAEWRARPIGEFPALDDVDRDRAQQLVTEVLRAQPGEDVMPAETTAELLGCYRLTLAGDVDGAGDAGGADDQADAAVPVTVQIADDPSFGAVVSFGLTGTPIEVFGDVAHRVLPLTDRDAADLIRSVRAWPLLDGYAGADPVDADALAGVILRAARLAEDIPEVRALTLHIRAGAAGARISAVRCAVAAARGIEAPRRMTGGRL